MGTRQDCGIQNVHLQMGMIFPILNLISNSVCVLESAQMPILLGATVSTDQIPPPMKMCTQRLLTIPRPSAENHNNEVLESDEFNLSSIALSLLLDDVLVGKPVKIPTPCLVTASSVEPKDEPPYKSEETTSVVLLDAAAVSVADEPVTSPASIGDA